MIKILMHGCNGRMGQMISGLVRDEEEMMIAAGVDTYQGVSNEYPVFGSIDACDDDVDVVIDFSNAAAADAVMEYCAKRQIPLVFCTTGLSEEQLQKLEDTAKQTAVLKSANMSLGINLLLKLLKDAAKACGVKQNVGTHTCRKTWGWHQYKYNSDKANLDISMLQRAFGHSSPEVTLRYLGITDEEDKALYRNMCIHVISDKGFEDHGFMRT